jgi:predicted ATPase
VIEQITVRDLFGYMSYILPEKGTMEDAAILYGENGTGKTTILKLVYHMLSAASAGGHRTAVSKIPFSFLSIRLTNKIEVRATRKPHILVGPCLLQIFRNNKLVGEWDYVPGPSRPISDNYLSEIYEATDSATRARIQRMSPQERRSWMSEQSKKYLPNAKQGEHAYIAALNSIGLGIYFLSAERQIYSEGSDHRELSYEIRSLAMEESFARIVEKGHELAIKAAMVSAWRWVASQAVAGTNAGGDSANVVYTDIVKRLANERTRSKTGKIKPLDSTQLIESLRALDRRSLEMSEYNFISPSRTDEIVEVLSSAQDSVLPMLQAVLEPFINGQRARMSALENIYEITHRFVSTLNDFYRGKRVVLDLGKGMSIVNDYDGAVLDPTHLSSGEQQLLLLFCNTLVSRARPSIFIIDEPEISLNVKWQRKLVQNLLDVSQGGNTQFIFASHSIELLTQHRDKVVPVKPIMGDHLESS